METNKEAARKFKKDMQEIANNSGSTISVSSSSFKDGEEIIIAKPETLAKKQMDFLKNENPSIDEIGAAIKNQNIIDKQFHKLVNMELKINKIKYDGSQVEIQYEQVMESTDDIKIVLKSNDKPLKEFIDCMQSLKDHIEVICCLPENYCEMADVRGVSISHTHDIMGAVITCLIPVSTANSPLCLNTPFLPEGQYNDGGTAPTLPRQCALIIHNLIHEAEKYINGERQVEDPDQLKMDI